MAISTNDSMQETEAIYTFYRVYDCWKTDNYTNNFKIDLAWRRANGATHYFSESITVKRNIMTTGGWTANFTPKTVRFKSILTVPLAVGI